MKKKNCFKPAPALLECLALLLLIALSCWVFYRDISRVEVFSAEGQAAAREDGLRYCLDEIRDSGTDLSVRGWAYEEGEDTKYFDCAIVLRREETGLYYRMPTSLVERRDVTEAYGEGKWDYAHGGFFARAEKEKLPAGEYEICIEYHAYTDPELYPTGQFVRV